MSSNQIYYVTTLLVYAGVDIMACLALKLQFGVSGLVNFGFIVFQAAGAYAAAVLSMPPETANGGFQQYVLGLQLPFPLPWLGGALVGGLLAVPVGLVVLRRLRSDYQAIALLVLSVIANTVITNARPFLNGAAGLSLVPPPLAGLLDTDTVGYQWLFVSLTAIACGTVFAAANRIVYSPYGRTQRAMRERGLAAAALGKNLVGLKMTMFVIGGAIAGWSGAILVGFIGVWSPATWLYPETIVLFAALIVGGLGNNLGAMLGALLVPVGFEEATRFLPNFGLPGFIPAMQWVAIGLLVIGFLWFRPRGTLPEVRRVYGAGMAPTPGRAREWTRTDRRSGVSSDGAEALLRAEGVERHFEGLRAVDGVSLAVSSGHITGLIGPNGAGKSTLLAVLAGALPVSAGCLSLGGGEITPLSPGPRAGRGAWCTIPPFSEMRPLPGPPGL